MTLRYGLADAWRLDSFRKMSKKSFTFDNGRSGPQSTVPRIDKFLVSQGIEERGGRLEAVASIRKLSDHPPLKITIWGHHLPPNNPTCFFDVTLLNEEKGKLELLNAWSGDAARPSTGRDWAIWLKEAMKRVANCNVMMAREKRRAQGAHVRSCTKKIQLAELQLQRDPTNSKVRGILSNAQGKKKALMRELETDSETVSGQQDLIHYVTSFYARLYKLDTRTLGTAKAQDLCWQSVPGMVSGDANASLISSLSLEKVGRAIRALPKGKAPGHDSIPMEFFHECV
ncbi:unnamed protein product [Sphagnum troendelagicum]|uniref:Uncharacterized protein n=1 Tax=Sphagnum troendelagicum TaxID=128251 RepID=A0ABP0TKB6_9BRYO